MKYNADESETSNWEVHMFRNLSAEMARQGHTIGKLANALGITPGTLSQKLNGKSELTLRQAADIKRILQVDLPLEVLFERTTT